jgi:mannose-6-phosphate isomerase-like protein (cupin superfamily)
MRSAEPTVRAQVVLPGPDLDDTISFFADRLGFRLLSIWPADDPRRAVMDGHGLCIELQRDGDRPPGVLRLLCREPLPGTAIGDVLTAPNGTRVELRAAEPAFAVPDGQATFAVSRADVDNEWVVGRAGMRYRDLLPDRQGGRFIASHIAIPDGGPVPDYVHYHRIRFQLIYCHRGWVRVVYEDQGEPFVLEAGDCVLQPPEIRHRVLEASPGLEVVELSCPAEHVTMVEHGFDLPTAVRRPDRDFGGQRFVRHRAAEAQWQPWRSAGYEARDTGIAAATDGLASVQVVRRLGTAVDGAAGGPVDGSSRAPVMVRHDAELWFLFVLGGTVTMAAEGHPPEPLTVGGSVAVPAGLAHRLEDPSADLELLEVALPAGFRTAVEGAR